MSDWICQDCQSSNPEDMPFCINCGKNKPEEKLPLLDGRYQLKTLLGEGGMSKVYLAEDNLSGQNVAIKCLKSERCQDRVGLERFMLEIKTLSQLNHPNLVKVLAYGSAPDPYYVMPFYDGGDLAARLEVESQFSPEYAAEIMKKLLAAVGVLHDSKIIHRDIKAENIMFSGDNEPVLLDLGAVKELEGQANRTAFGIIVGSAIALAPEQITGQQLTARTDIYQLGVLFCELLLGRAPFEAENTSAWVAAHLQQTPQITADEKLRSPELIKIAFRALSKNPADRYQSTAQMAQAIDMAMGKKLSFTQRIKNLFG